MNEIDGRDTDYKIELIYFNSKRENKIVIKENVKTNNLIFSDTSFYYFLVKKREEDINDR